MPTERPETPLDEALAAALAQAQAGKPGATRDRGFTMYLANEADEETGRRIAISVKPERQEPDEWEWPTPLRNHELHDLDSLIAYAQRHGDAEDAVVMVAAGAITLTLDEQRLQGERETLTTPLEAHEDLRRWVEIGGARLDHRKLIDFLSRLKHTIVDADTVMSPLRTLKNTSRVHTDSVVTDASGTTTVTVKTGDDEDLLKFATSMTLKLPVFDFDTEAEALEAKARLRIEHDADGLQAPSFNLELDDYKATNLQRTRRQQIRDKIAEHLGDGWLVVLGRRDERPHRVGWNGYWNAMDDYRKRHGSDQPF